jgi:hypothetical protein
LIGVVVFGLPTPRGACIHSHQHTPNVIFPSQQQIFLACTSCYKVARALFYDLTTFVIDPSFCLTREQKEHITFHYIYSTVLQLSNLEYRARLLLFFDHQLL